MLLLYFAIHLSIVANGLAVQVGPFWTRVLSCSPANYIRQLFASIDAIGMHYSHALLYVVPLLQFVQPCAMVDMRHVCRPRTGK